MSRKEKECFGSLLCRLEELDLQIVKMKAQIRQLRILITNQTDIQPTYKERNND